MSSEVGTHRNAKGASEILPISRFIPRGPVRSQLAPLSAQPSRPRRGMEPRWDTRHGLDNTSWLARPRAAPQPWSSGGVVITSSNLQVREPWHALGKGALTGKRPFVLGHWWRDHAGTSPPDHPRLRAVATLRHED